MCHGSIGGEGGNQKAIITTIVIFPEESIKAFNSLLTT